MTIRMSRISMLALAATAAVAASALTPTDASAWGRFGGYHRAFGWHGGYAHAGFHRWGGYRWGGYGYRHAFWWGRYRFPYRWYPRPIVYGAVGAAAVAPVAAAVAPAPAPAAGCLTKQYLPNGGVVFADTCTQEQAIAGPNGQPGPAAQ